jgi:hypothetical protein
MSDDCLDLGELKLIREFYANRKNALFSVFDVQSCP